MTLRVLLIFAIGCGRIEFAANASDAGAGGPAGLVARFAFDNGCEEVAAGITVSCMTGQCPTTEPGVTGGAAHFDGVDDACITASDSRLQLTAGFTLSVWAKFDVIMFGGTLVSKYLPAPPGASFELGYGYDNGLAYFCTTAPGPSERCLFSPTISTTIGTWYHVAATWDGSTKLIYWDGAVVAMDVLQPTTWDTTPLQLGADNEGGITTPLLGALDEVRIYDRALDASEILALATKP